MSIASGSSLRRVTPLPAILSGVERLTRPNRPNLILVIRREKHRKTIMDSTEYEVVPELNATLGPFCFEDEYDNFPIPAELHYAIHGVGIVVNIVVVVVFMLHFRPFSATILTLSALAMADGAYLMAIIVYSYYYYVDQDSFSLRYALLLFSTEVRQCISLLVDGVHTRESVSAIHPVF